jgi:hypothetical protein
LADLASSRAISLSMSIEPAVAVSRRALTSSTSRALSTWV